MEDAQRQHFLAEIAKRDEEIAKRDEEIAKRDEEIRLLKEKVDLLIRKVFGKSSEQLDPAQLELLFDPDSAKKPTAAEVSSDAPAAKALNIVPFKKPAKPRKVRLPEHLPVEEIFIDPESVRANPHGYRCIGQEISEQLDYRPGKFLCRRTVRRKYVKLATPDAAPIIAPLPNKLQEACLATPGLIAEVISNKYTYHLPFYRQEQLYKQRHRVEVSRQNMIHWEALAADWLQPIYELLREQVIDTSHLQADETCIKYIEKGKGQTQHGYLWVYRNSQGHLFFEWHDNRAHTCLEKTLENFKGVLQTDGYAAYDTYCKSRNKTETHITQAACWAHVRRKFFETKSPNGKHSQPVAWILRQISHLYHIESQLRQTRAGPRLIAAIRTSHSRMIYQRLGKYFAKLQQRILPQSSLGQALSYALNLWPRLGVYLTDGSVQIDNNLIENAIRPTAIGKKNWLFFGTPKSGYKAALFYTLIENCRRLDIDPHEYLKDVLERLPNTTNHQVHTLLPSQWLAEKTNAAKHAPLQAS
jgi:transposase